MQMNRVMISEAIDRLGVSKFTFKIYILIGLTLLFDGFDYMIVPYTMSQISGEWGLTKVQTGALASWGLLGLMIGGLFGGVISDRFGRKKTLVACCAFYSILTLPIYFVQSYETFAILRILAGMGLGACIPVSITLMSEFAPTKNRGFFTSSIMAFYVAGWVIAGIVAAYVVPLLGWRFCFLIGAMPVFYAIILAIKLIESPHWLLSKGRERDAINVIQTIEKTVNGKASEWVPGSLIVPPPPKSVGVRAIISLDYRKTTINLFIIYFMGSMVVYGVTAWLPTLLILKGYGLTQSYVLSILINIASIAGSLATGYAADIIGRRNNIVYSYVFTAGIIVLLGLATSLWLTVIIGVMAGIAITWGLSGVQPVLAEAYRTEFRNTGVAWVQAFGRLGGITGPIAAGIIQQIGFGFTGTLIFFAFPSIIVAIVAYMYVTETKGRTIESLAAVKA